MVDLRSDAHADLVWVPVDATNWRDAYTMQPRDDQREFVAPNAYSLLEGLYTPNLTSLLAYEVQVPVAYALYGDDPDEPGSDPVWLIRYLVAGEHQGRGIGSRALGLVLERIAAENPGRPVRLGVVEDNVVARRLYERFGFVATGDVAGREAIYERSARE